MRALDVMRRYPRVATPDMDLARAGRTMGEARCGILPVVGEGERVVGVLTDRDLALTASRLDERPSRLTVRHAMSPEAWTCHPEAPVLDALAVMREHRVRRLPVVDHAGRLEGILSLDDVAAEARPERAASPGHPLDQAVAETLRAICEHPVPAGV
ncbi:MAG TPA: CBS domain-containing protein [Thermoanaerobaculia bacterium]